MTLGIHVSWTGNLQARQSDWLLTGSAIRALHEERVAGCSHGNRVHEGGRWSRTVGEADGDKCTQSSRRRSFVGGSLSARLTRSKTLGSDRSVGSRQTFIDASYFIERKEWLHEGWRVLCMAAAFDRDYLLPSPTTKCNGCLPSELRYDTAYAMQKRVLYSLRKEGNAVFTRVSTSFWTLHSARAFLPSCTKALGVRKEERDCLGRWSARGSDTYSRVAVRVISNLQRLVIQGCDRMPIPWQRRRPSFNSNPSCARKELGQKSVRNALNSLARDSVSIPVARTTELAVEEVGPLNPSEVIPDTEQHAEMAHD